MAKVSTPKARAQAEASKQAGVKLNGDPLPDFVVVKVVLKSPFGFYDEDGSPCFWQAGQEVTDPDDIEVLVERDAPIDIFGEESPKE
jgi:hypothetical protein